MPLSSRTKSRNTSTLRSLALVAMLALIGCRSTRAPRPLDAPTTTLRVLHYEGSPLSGPRPVTEGPASPPIETTEATGSTDPDAPEGKRAKTGLEAPAPAADDALAVRVTVTAFETWPESPLTPLGRAAALIAGPGDGEALRPTQTITSRWRFQAVESVAELAALADRFSGSRRRKLATGWAILRDGMTAEFALEPRADEGVVRVRVGRNDGTVRLALGLVESGAEGPAEETVLIDPGHESGVDAVCCLLGPSPFSSDWPAAFAFTIEGMPAAAVQERDGEAYRAALAERDRDLAHRKAATDVGRQTAKPDAFVDAIDALTWRARRQDALRYLSSATGATLARDLVNVFDREQVRTLAERLHEAVGNADEAPTPEALGWTLERNALDLVLAIVAEDEEAMPPAIAGILSRHTGEVGRDPSTLRTLTALSRSLEGFTKRITIENRYALEDVSPAARLRAFDWLERRGEAPRGFDPLADGKVRRKQLVAAEAAAAKKAAEANNAEVAR